MTKSYGDYTLKQLSENIKNDIFESLNCHSIGKIEIFDSAKQTAQISILYTQKSVQKDGQPAIDFPLLVDVPVIFLCGGSGGLTFPVSSGDECLVLFNDRDIDKWFASGAKTDTNSNRKHAFSDAVAIVGLHSLKKTISTFSSDRTELFHSDTKISLKDKIKIMNASASLFTILDGVLGVLAVLTTTNCVPGAPVSISPAQATQIQNFKTQLGQLLES